MPVATGSRLTDAQIAGYAKDAGFTGQNLVIAVAVALAESGGDPRAHNPNRLTGDNSYGLWQINMIDKLGPARRKQFGISSNEELFNPSVNARAARAIFLGRGSWRDWTTYTTGKHLVYMSRARKAANAPDTSGGNGSVQQAGFSDGMDAVGDFFTFITDTRTWMQAGMILAGGILVLFALYGMSGQATRIGKVAGMVTDALPQTRGLKAAAKAA